MFLLDLKSFERTRDGFNFFFGQMWEGGRERTEREERERENGKYFRG